MCLANGGAFIKVGQHIGSLDYLLPTEYVKTMSILYDKVPLTPVKEMLEVFKEEFGQEVSKIKKIKNKKILSVSFENILCPELEKKIHAKSLFIFFHFKCCSSLLIELDRHLISSYLLL